jgi:hypothetical protein
MSNNLREAVAYAISHGNLTQNHREETAADLIGALAMADPLGAALWRVTGNLDASAFRRARALLLAWLQKHYLNVPPELLRRVCQQALEEWLACLCSTCEGRAYVTSEAGVRSTCRACRGTGRGRSSDAERMKAMGIGKATYSKLVDVLNNAHEELSAADRRVVRQMSQQLGRKVPQVKAKSSKV